MYACMATRQEYNISNEYDDSESERIPRRGKVMKETKLNKCKSKYNTLVPVSPGLMWFTEKKKKTLSMLNQAATLIWKKKEYSIQ